MYKVEIDESVPIDKKSVAQYLENKGFGLSDGDESIGHKHVHDLTYSIAITKQKNPGGCFEKSREVIGEIIFLPEEGRRTKLKIYGVKNKELMIGLANELCRDLDINVSVLVERFEPKQEKPWWFFLVYHP